jgi:Rrf2 family protein
MKLSTRARYAVRCMVDLAQHGRDHHVPRKEIAARQDISPHYLEQLFARLRDAGLIEVVRGRGGGYMLSKRPEEITVAEVVRAVEEVLTPVPCLRPGDVERCQRAPTCATRRLWRDLEQATDEFLESRTIRDLFCEVPEPGHEQ